MVLVNGHLSNAASDVADVAWDPVAPAPAHSEEYVLVAENDIHGKDETTGAAELALIVRCGRSAQIVAIVPGPSCHRSSSHLRDLLLLNAARTRDSVVEFRPGMILACRNNVGYGRLPPTCHYLMD